MSHRDASGQSARSTSAHGAADDPCKGVFITTSRFSREARDCAARASDSLVLLDGDELADIMLDYKVGVSVRETLTLVSVDSDYFEDDYDTLG